MQKKLPDWLIDHIPEYKNTEYVKPAFTDSTHQLWRLHASKIDQKNHFLKVCSNTKSPFWQIMQDVFYFDLYNEIDSFSETYAFISQVCGLKPPELISAKKIADNKAYILTTEIDGSVVGNKYHSQMVRQLAQHLSELHAHSSSQWGSLNMPIYNAFDWASRLEVTLIKNTNQAIKKQERRPKVQTLSAVETSKKWGGGFLNGNTSGDYLNQAIAACALIKPSQFVPIMPDLRWDQFLQIDDALSALVDLDAFVRAPRELDFAILEYMLSSEQCDIFIQEYTKYHSIPDLGESRVAYRLLLFYMQVLGEADLDAWMNRETLF